MHTEPRGSARPLSENDYYVRLPLHQLEAIELNHVATTIEPELIGADPAVRGCRGWDPFK
jgi:hypothetical protein